MVPNSVLRLYSIMCFPKCTVKMPLWKWPKLIFSWSYPAKLGGAKKSQFFSITSEHRGPMVFELQEAAVEFQRSLGNGLTKAVDVSCCCRASLGTLISSGTHLGSLDTITCAGTHFASVVAPTALIWDILLTILPTIFWDDAILNSRAG